MKMIKRSFAALVAIGLLISSIPMAFASAQPSQADDVELICEVRTRDLSFACDGGRETKVINLVTSERVWGWSTCKDAAGGNVYHYTVARYEQGGATRDGWTSGRVWGYGKVYAYSPYIDSNNTAQLVRARVYYGY